MKKVFLLFLPLFLCGCSVNYTANLNIDGSIEELVVIEEPNLLEKDDTVYFNIKDTYSALINKYKGFSSNAKYVNEGKDYQIIANRQSREIKNILKEYNELIEKYEYSGIINKKLNFTIKEDIFSKYNFDELKLNIKIPYKVTNSNSDQNIGNYYTWNINKNSRRVNVEFDTTQNKVKLDNSSLNNNLQIVLYIVLGIVLFSFILIPFLILNKDRRI